MLRLNTENNRDDHPLAVALRPGRFRRNRRILPAYGGVFVAGSLAWDVAVDKFQPAHWDYVGAAMRLLGVATIIFAPRS